MQAAANAAPALDASRAPPPPPPPGPFALTMLLLVPSSAPAPPAPAPTPADTLPSGMPPAPGIRYAPSSVATAAQDRSLMSRSCDAATASTPRSRRWRGEPACAASDCTSTSHWGVLGSPSPRMLASSRCQSPPRRIPSLLACVSCAARRAARGEGSGSRPPAATAAAAAPAFRRPPAPAPAPAPPDAAAAAAAATTPGGSVMSALSLRPRSPGPAPLPSSSSPLPLPPAAAAAAAAAAAPLPPLCRCGRGSDRKVTRAYSSDHTACTACNSVLTRALLR